MNVLLTYPEYPDTFFSFKHSLHFISRKAALPPLGLITISAQLPATWERKLVDLNTSPLLTSDLQWADYVFISAMIIQMESVNRIIEAGINSTFIGIETPSENALQDCKKVQNRNRDMLQNVKEIQKSGMLVSGGFIVGFDSDTPDVFQQQIDFIQQSGIVWAMVGLLNAPKNTRLYKRLETENRLTTEVTGNNTDFSMNFVPRMNSDELLKGYHSILQNTYAIKPYYKRIRHCLINLKPTNRRFIRIDRYYLLGFFKSIFIIGVLDKGRGEYWKLMIWTLLNRPGLFLYTIMFTICGYHFRRIYGLSPSTL